MHALHLLFLLLLLERSSAAADSNQAILRAIAENRREMRTGLTALQAHFDARLDDIEKALSSTPRPKPVAMTPATSKGTSCPLPFRRAGPNLCLVATKKRTSWYEARNWCRSAQGDLVNLRSDADYAAVSAFAKKVGFPFDKYWTSLRRRGRRLVWETDPTNSYRGVLRRADLYVIKPLRNCFSAFAKETRSPNTIMGTPCTAWHGVMCYRKPV